MDRIDSACAASSSPSNMANQESLPLHRSKSTSTRQPASKTSAVGSSSALHLAHMDHRRPVSEHRSRPLRQQSTTSSENSTNRSKSRGGHGSKPSSRRTSCTIVDPSRPARHYRIKSFQTPSAAPPTHDIDDVLALHFRSCSIFTNPSYHASSALPSPTLSQSDAPPYYPTTATRFSTDDSLRVVQECPPTADPPTTQKTNTTMHWTSPCTRKREYERIDKANSGLRGFLRKITPSSLSGPHESFYNDKIQNHSDAGSVRRYRISTDRLAVHHGAMEEKQDGETNNHDNHNNNRPRTSPVPRPASSRRKKKKWICF
ncbi:hypothetical protein ACJQWK_06654 [Exserohilum turcicum]|uniref:Uncharacterized protein n=1 Tax=Exserohilum turcicum (strain 28A) TaxID=671987 RepID=R0K5G0_EXST2|nr:uncharacterized protein SETTUDRAFT_163605 [Exserohilum turcica Et28A]EOA84759.1 hypothetical protein SETTUDRAFT_163605 [Exserohilum turcica Et28A]